MRQRDLEILLDKHVPAFPSPKAELEQYRTPAPVAADLLYKAYALGDVAEKRVVDLGCGTGMLACGAALLGARVVAVDVDADALAAASRAATALAVDVAFEHADVAAWRGQADVAISNPPFGAQRPGADRPFLEAAIRAAPVAYVFSNAGTEEFVRRFAADLGAAPTHAWPYAFAVPHQFRFHTRARQDVAVVVHRLVRPEVDGG